VVTLLVPGGQPVTVAIDDTLFRRRGKKVWAASWFHDGSAAGKDKTGYGNNWVIAGIVVTLPMVSRPVCLPVLAQLVVKGTNSASRLWLARRMAEDLAPPCLAAPSAWWPMPPTRGRNCGNCRPA
jgi:DDE superfamily endonuclease